MVLARENSSKEIAAIRARWTGPRHRGRRIPLEVFVHGALCVAYSGQCLTSGALGGLQRQPRRMRAGLPDAL